MFALAMKIPPFTRFAMCRRCIVSICWLRDAEGRRVSVECNGSLHANKCTGSAEYRKIRADEERLAELLRMREKGEAS